MVFCLAFAQFAGWRWNSSITVIFYGGIFAWVVLLVRRQPTLWAGLGKIDALFCVFVVWVLMSLLIQSPEPAAWGFGRYLPFLVILPYVCGRLIRAFDLSVFYQIIVWASIVLLMLLVIDYRQHLSKIEIYSRWPFFGFDYAVLLVAMLLAAALIVLTSFFFAGPGKSHRQLSPRQLVQLGILGLIAAALVASASRGTLLLGIFGTLCVVFFVRDWSFSNKLKFLLFLAAFVSSAYLLLPKQQAQIYSKSLAIPDMVLTSDSRTWDTVLTSDSLTWNTVSIFDSRGREVGSVWDKVTLVWDNVVLVWDNVVLIWHRASLAGRDGSGKSVPVFGAASCRPIEQGTDSVAIRFVLYQEAKEIFTNNPLWGVGAASFGRYSCAGVKGYPHSTILQSFAELGIVGGLLYCGLLVGALFGFIRQAFNRGKKTQDALGKLSLSLFLMYLLMDQIYGNYFMAVGSYFLIGVAASIQTNPAWNTAPELGNV